MTSGQKKRFGISEDPSAFFLIIEAIDDRAGPDQVRMRLGQ